MIIQTKPFIDEYGNRQWNQITATFLVSGATRKAILRSFVLGTYRRARSNCATAIGRAMSKEQETMIKVENKILIEVGEQKLALTPEEARELYEKLCEIYDRRIGLTKDQLAEIQEKWSDKQKGNLLHPNIIYIPPSPIVYGPAKTPFQPYDSGDVFPNPFEVTCKQ